jgi:hypothetical protein
MEAPALDEPFDLQIYACIDEGVEVLIHVFEREGVGVGEVRGD